jgi:hypothetical protein
VSTTHVERAGDLAEQAYETAHAGDKSAALVEAVIAVAYGVLALTDAICLLRSRPADHGPHHKGSTWCRCGSAFTSPELLADHLEAVGA